MLRHPRKRVRLGAGPVELGITEMSDAKYALLNSAIVPWNYQTIKSGGNLLITYRNLLPALGGKNAIDGIAQLAQSELTYPQRRSAIKVAGPLYNI